MIYSGASLPFREREKGFVAGYLLYWSRLGYVAGFVELFEAISWKCGKRKIGC